MSETIEKILSGYDDPFAEIMVSIDFQDPPEIDELEAERSNLSTPHTSEQFKEAGITVLPDGNVELTPEVNEKITAWEEKYRPRREELCRQIEKLKDENAAQIVEKSFQSFLPLDTEKGERIRKSTAFSPAGISLLLTPEEIRAVYQYEDIRGMIAEMDDLNPVDYTYIGSDEGDEEQNRDTGAC